MSWNLERIQNEIQAFQEFAREVIGNTKGVESLTNCPIEISKRMTKCKGKFEFDYLVSGKKIVGVKPLKIKIAQVLLNEYYDEDIVETIKHECVHLIVNVDEKKNMGHNAIFKMYCRKLGVSDETYFTAVPKNRMKLGIIKYTYKESKSRTRRKTTVKTKAQLLGSLRRMKAYELIDSCGYTDNFDTVWFDMFTIYNDGGYGSLTQRQMDTLYKWLCESKKYCEDSYNTGVLVGRVYV